MDKNIVIDGLLVDALVDCVERLMQYNPMTTDEQRQLAITSRRCVDAAVAALTARFGSITDSPATGNHSIDPSKSSFL